MRSLAFHLRSALLAAVVAGLASGGAAPAQSVPAPVGEEAFRVLLAFYDCDARIPLDARVEETKEAAGGVRLKVVFRGARGFLVPGYLEFPAAGKPPYPCVLLLHNWSGSKDGWWEDGNYISGGDARKALLAKGYAVFALDALGHGERVGDSGDQVANPRSAPGASPPHNYFTLRELVTQTVVDYRRGLDYLATRGDVDMQRIGLLGYSMGAFQAFALTAAEPRIKVAVGCAVPASWSQDLVLSPTNYARGVGKRPFCMLMGRRDEMCSEAQARELRHLMPGAGHRLIFYDAGHQLPVDYVRDAVAFISAYL